MANTARRTLKSQVEQSLGFQKRMIYPAEPAGPIPGAPSVRRTGIGFQYPEGARLRAQSKEASDFWDPELVEQKPIGEQFAIDRGKPLGEQAAQMVEEGLQPRPEPVGFRAQPARQLKRPIRPKDLSWASDFAAKQIARVSTMPREEREAEIDKVVERLEGMGGAGPLEAAEQLKDWRPKRATVEELKASRALTLFLQKSPEEQDKDVRNLPLDKPEYWMGMTKGKWQRMGTGAQQRHKDEASKRGFADVLEGLEVGDTEALTETEWKAKGIKEMTPTQRKVWLKEELKGGKAAARAIRLRSNLFKLSVEKRAYEQALEDGRVVSNPVHDFLRALGLPITLDPFKNPKKILEAMRRMEEQEGEWGKAKKWPGIQKRRGK
jgi:hypothetical protein